MLENVRSRGCKRVGATGSVDRAAHLFYGRFINYLSVIRADAAFEAALGIALLAGFGASDFPHPVGRVAVMAAGAVLLAVALVLWRGVVGPRELAVANLVTAAAAVVWVVFASGFSPAGTALVLATAAGLAALAALQLTARA